MSEQITQIPTPDPQKTIDELVDKLTADLITGASAVNSLADKKDLERNHVNYGAVTTCANVLRHFGHKVDVPVWEDKGFLRIPKVVINDRIVNFHNGV